MMKGKNIVITGANRGMGKRLTEAFAQNGANVWACARKKNDEFEAWLQELADLTGTWTKPVYFDMADDEEIKQAAKAILAEKEKISALINNAGITYNALFQMSSAEMNRQVMQINYFGPYLFTQYISKAMSRQRYGSIINVASAAALDGNPGRSVYGASKAALICMTKTLAEELGQYGVRANAVAPGMIESEMLNQSMTEKNIEETLKRSIMKRLCKPEEVINPVLFLASDDSSYVTGQVIRVDGGAF